MATLTITLDDTVLSRLEERARETSSSVEDVARAYMLASMQTDSAVSLEFKELTDSLLATYRPLLHRLAQ